MKKLTEKVHHEESNEVVWIRREEAPQENVSQKKTKCKNKSKLPIVYCNKYCVRFCGMERLHPFDAKKGYHIAKVSKLRYARIVVIKK